MLSRHLVRKIYGKKSLLAHEGQVIRIKASAGPLFPVYKAVRWSWPVSL